MKTAELTGALLDYWVARAEKHKAEMLFGQCVIQHAEYHDEVQYVHFNPSYNWAHGGPLIEKYEIDVDKLGAHWYTIAASNGCAKQATGDTPLQAICRAVVRATYGDEVPG